MDSSSVNSNCIFCSLIAKNENIIFQDENVFVISDIKPVSKYHLLVISRKHIIDAKCLTKDDKTLLETMMDRAKILLQDKEIDFNDSRLVFHWPPFHTVPHLHLHVIAPVSGMSILNRLMFKTNTWWAVNPEYVLKRISEE